MNTLEEGVLSISASRGEGMVTVALLASALCQLDLMFWIIILL